MLADDRQQLIEVKLIVRNHKGNREYFIKTVVLRVVVLKINLNAILKSEILVFSQIAVVLQLNTVQQLKHSRLRASIR